MLRKEEYAEILGCWPFANAVIAGNRQIQASAASSYVNSNFKGSQKATIFKIESNEKSIDYQSDVRGR